MKKPYMKKIGLFSGYKVFYVNGYFIRRNIDKRFPNYGLHRTFKFVPKNEFWIDYENSSKEARFIIINFLAFQKELEKGKSEAEANRIATRIEKREREKSKILMKLKKFKLKTEIIKRVHIKRLFKKYTKNMHIWRVKGKLVRDLFNVDFNQGGHGYVYPFIPKNEVWIDDASYYKELPFILIHELHERRLMARGWKYDSVGLSKTLRKKGDNRIYAHPAAEDLEYWCRKHPKSIKRVLFKELSKNESLTKFLTKK